MAISAIITAIFSGIVALIAVQTGGIMIGLVVFFAVFLLLSGGGLTLLAGISPNAILVLIVIVILFKLIKDKK